VYQRLLRDSPHDMVPQLRNLLGTFLFSGDDIDRPVRVLSGGEKSRLGLARLLLRPSNLLLLDEPTNHLDIASREALIEALREFPGTLVVVSHDRFFVDLLATRVIALSHGRAEVYEGNYSEYLWSREHRAESEGDGASAGAADLTTGPIPASSEEQRRRDDWKNRRKESNRRQKLEKEISEAERLVGELERSVQDIEQRLANPDGSEGVEALTRLAKDHETRNADLASAMSRWEALHAELATLDASG